MKRVKYKIPITLKRLSPKEVELTMHEDKREVVKEEAMDLRSTDIPNKAVEFAEANNKRMEIAKGTLFKGENERQSFLEMEYLE